LVDRVPASFFDILHCWFTARSHRLRMKQRPRSFQIRAFQLQICNASNALSQRFHCAVHCFRIAGLKAA
jgi:hypothetical protein